MLEDHADVTAFLAQLALTHLHQVASANEYFAARRTFQHIDAADEGRLARTRQSDDAVDRAASDMEINTAQSVDVPLVCFDNVFQIYHMVVFLWLRLRLNVAHARLFVNITNHGARSMALDSFYE